MQIIHIVPDGDIGRQKLAGEVRSRPPRPRALRQENSSPGPQRANRLENNNKQSAPVTWKSQRELPGIRKTDGQSENECIHFLACPAVFSLCALRTARQQSWLPGSVGLRYPSDCGKLLVIEIAQHPPLAGSGVQLAPRWGMGQSPIVLPVKFLFFSVLL